MIILKVPANPEKKNNSGSILKTSEILSGTHKNAFNCASVVVDLRTNQRKFYLNLYIFSTLWKGKFIEYTEGGGRKKTLIVTLTKPFVKIWPSKKLLVEPQTFDSPGTISVVWRKNFWSALLKSFADHFSTEGFVSAIKAYFVFFFRADLSLKYVFFRFHYCNPLAFTPRLGYFTWWAKQNAWLMNRDFFAV